MGHQPAPETNFQRGAGRQRRFAYPALHKLEHRGWIRAHWKPSENNRRAKFYSLTGLGRKQLEKETANWNRLSAAISEIVQLKEA